MGFVTPFWGAASSDSSLLLRNGVKLLSERGQLSLTNQGADVREDSVGWFDDFEPEEGDEAPMETQALRSGLSLLRAVAQHLNANGVHGEPFVDLAEGEICGAGKASTGRAAPPLQPATIDNPLTVPSHVMVALYPAGGTYCPHSDNGLEWVRPAGTNERVARRRNHRCFTAILYANRRDWDKSVDGGCLRVYLESGGGPASVCGQALLNPGNAGLDEAVECWPRGKVVEVAPIGGRLVIFDSTLIHEVRPSISESRRALTMWIGRPCSNEARGETWDLGDGLL